MNGGIWSIATVIGPILFALVALYVILGNRKRSAADKARTEAGTRRLHEQLNAEDAARDGPTIPPRN